MSSDSTAGPGEKRPITEVGVYEPTSAHQIRSPCAESAESITEPEHSTSVIQNFSLHATMMAMHVRVNFFLLIWGLGVWCEATPGVPR